MDARDRIIEQRMAKRRKNAFVIRSMIVVLILLILFLGGLLIWAGLRNGSFTGLFNRSAKAPKKPKAETPVVEQVTETEAKDTSRIQDVLDRSALLAAQYDYQAAIDLVRQDPSFNEDSRLQDAAATYQNVKDACEPYPIDQVTHVFFHSLIRDTDKAFDGDEKEAGYNQVMTTIREFNSIIEQMYERGYVMVSLHDMCEIHEDGSVTAKEIRLPSGKKPFVLSQDDVSYYHYMDGDGYPNKLIVDENGEVKNSYIEDDGSISIGDYDMVPLIDTFVKEHPDFSYHGHKGIIALTGYEGVLGYRTDEVYKTREESRVTDFQRKFFEANPDFDWDAEVAEATKVASAMRAEGWEFASHTWGHINPISYGYESTVRDTERWLEYVAPIVGGTDVLIFAFGADIGDWHPYTSDNPYFVYLKEHGFSIFCNVDSAPYWVQFGPNYMRQARRNLDGYRMYYNPDMLSDLYDVEKAWDPARPTPVPAI